MTGKVVHFEVEWKVWKVGEEGCGELVRLRGVWEVSPKWGFAGWWGKNCHY